MLFSTCLFVYNARNSLSRCPNSTKIVVRTGGAYSAPQTPSWIQGALLLRLLLLRGGEGRGGRGWEERGGEDPEKLCTPKNSLK